jgi:crotonobetainyl-CoA:carnitine CoA-transferase CaiB-like acyl-CoA transferase
VVSAITDRVKDKSAQYWVDRLQTVGVPSGLVKSVREALDGTNADAASGVPPSVPGSVRLPPPRLDEHGDAIRTLGWRAFE